MLSIQTPVDDLQIHFSGLENRGLSEKGDDDVSTLLY